MRRRQLGASGVKTTRLFCACFLLACESRLVVGELACPPSEGGAPPRPASGVINEGPLPAPWQTSFDDGFCSYRQDAGFCYEDANEASTYRLVTTPTRSGPFAAAFDLGVDDSEGVHQARCVREGVLPDEATYGAWYYIPSGSSDPINWNLIHFQGGVPGEELPGMWDVNVEQSEEGELSLYIANLRGKVSYRAEEPLPLPADRWFHLEFYLKRAADETGEVALFQDGEELVRASGIVTDDNPFAQWYVGNFTIAITPPRSTLYVDDVSIHLGPP